jgi:hypothetical protein
MHAANSSFPQHPAAANHKWNSVEERELAQKQLVNLIDRQEHSEINRMPNEGTMGGAEKREELEWEA